MSAITHLLAASAGACFGVLALAFVQGARVEEDAKEAIELRNALNRAAGNWAKVDAENRELESLARDMLPFVLADGAYEEFERRMEGLGIGGAE